jgi:sarcosine oxidase subunit gamma
MLDVAPNLPALAGSQGPLDPALVLQADGALVSVGKVLDRLVLRGDPTAFGPDLALPRRVGSAADLGEVAALCLGPDEWLLLGARGEASIAALRSFDGETGAAVDVGNRQLALLVEGPRASELLNAGCPLDLHVASFPPGRCTRTLLGKAEIVLWRRAPEQFHAEVARSFAAYVWAFLAEAALGVRR